MSNGRSITRWTSSISRKLHSDARFSRGAISSVHRGTAFESRCVDILKSQLSMSLQRVGGKSDGGVDFIGWWWLPDLAAIQSLSHEAFAGLAQIPRKRVRVLGQCKAEKKKTGPNYIREMEGVMYRYLHDLASTPAEFNAATALVDEESQASESSAGAALFLSESPFTKSTLLRANSSPLPFFLLHIPPLIPSATDETPVNDAVGSAVWNPALASMLQNQVEVRWEWSTSAQGTGRPGLWLRGRRVDSWTPGC